MGFPFQSLTFGSAPAASGIDPVGGQTAPTLASLIVSLSIAALTLSLTFAAVISLIVWAVG